jgi:hypothetical protein
MSRQWLQDVWPKAAAEYLLEAFEDVGIVRTLVATLEHESPFCVAAAAGALGWVGKTPGVGTVSLESSGAMPALVGVIKRGIPAGNLEDVPGVFRRYAR